MISMHVVRLSIGPPRHGPIADRRREPSTDYREDCQVATEILYLLGEFLASF